MNRFSFSTRVTVMFALTAIMTAVILTCVLTIIWNMQFQGYSDENLQTVAQSAATNLQQRYATSGSWSNGTLDGLPAIAQLAKECDIRVTDATGTVIYDSENGGATPASNLPDMSGDIKTAAVTATASDGTVSQVGEVQTAAIGEYYLTQTDREYRSNSFIGITIAALVAVILAILLGLGAVRVLVKPINMITDTVAELRAGNLAARSHMGGYDELGKLGKTLDEMAQTIEKNQNYERQITVDIAHELRTPLMAMQATIEAMQDGVLPTDAERLAVLDEEVRRLSRLVNQQMKLSRLERRAVEMNLEEINLGDLIAGLVIAHEMLAEEAQLTINFKADPNVLVYGDADLLRQGTANLISNAVRYTPAGGTIDIMVKHGQLMGQIIVKDTGIGISADNIKNVFTKFWRAEGDRNRENGGLGIGLAMVKEIADMHHGWVNVESVLGQGTTFTIYVPLYTETMRRLNKKVSQIESEGATEGE
jgi:signal transduction histidine kinase